MSREFRERLSRGEKLFGTLLALGSPPVAEILGRAGFDWLFLDLEHSAQGPAEALQLLNAAGSTATLIRVESRDEVGIRKALDLGPTGIIVPQVGSEADARRMIGLAKYPPAGTRSVGLGRACNFGNDFAAYMARANDESAVVLQIEHIDALKEIDAIVAVPGVDAVFVGPYDLSGSMGMPGALEHAAVKEAIDSVLAAARRAGIAAGIFAAGAERARAYAAQGFSLIAAGTDGLFLGRAAAAELQAVRG